jgi:hypothetical protein
MLVVITAAERASFQRCRRQWDFGSGNRQDLEPLDRPAGPDLDRALRDALAVYYFPGMWDWDRGVRLPLVGQELERALARQRADPSGSPPAGSAAPGCAARPPTSPRPDGGSPPTWPRWPARNLDFYPEPSDQNCPPCPYLDPCRALQAGTQPILLSGYRKRPPGSPEEGRLGGRSWSMGRGAAPPKFQRSPDS